MRIDYGHTRFVILVGDRAVKIVRIRPLHALAVIAHVLYSRKRRDRFIARHGPSSYRSAWREFWDGLYVNRNEYRYYHASQDPRVMPTKRQLLGGWIVIQQRGRPVANAYLPEALRVRVQGYVDGTEMAKPWQYCHHPDDDRIVLVDYGNTATIATLSETLAAK